MYVDVLRDIPALTVLSRLMSVHLIHVSMDLPARIDSVPIPVPALQDSRARTVRLISTIVRLLRVRMEVSGCWYYMMC